MRQVSNLKQIEKELVADVYVNRNKTITHALFSTSIFHGYNDLLIGELPETSLSVTSRIFGFCGGSHQQAAVMALEHIANATVPPNAHLVRSIVQAAEILQNSIKWFYTSFAPDLAHFAFHKFPLHQTVCKRFQAFKGTSFRQGIIGGTYPIALFSLIAGQWPHAGYIIPGGLAHPLSKAQLEKAKTILQDFRQQWLEPVLLNGTLTSYLEVDTWEGLLAWFFSKKEHQNGDLGLFFRTCMEYGFDEMGGGKNSFLSFGTFWKKNSTLTVSPQNFTKSTLFPSGTFNRKHYTPLNPAYFIDHLKNEAKLPAEELFQKLRPYETGSLARMLLQGKKKVAKDAPKCRHLIKDMFRKKGASTFIRTFARLHEIMILCDFIERQLSAIEINAPYFQDVHLQDGVGFGMTEAPRGSLAHLVALQKGRIQKYQILAPTVCNINSGVTAKKTAPLGQALKGVIIKDLENPIEVGVIARSFDTCLRCTVNLWKSSSKQRIGKVIV